MVLQSNLNSLNNEIRFSRSNLENILWFYLEYSKTDDQNSQTPSGILSWESRNPKKANTGFPK